MKQILILLALILILVSCKKDPIDATSDDYREDYLGTYTATKSTKSFDDDLFATNIEVVIQAIDSTDSMILVNDFVVELLEDGSFGEGRLQGGFIGADSIRFRDKPFELGIVIPCFIKGIKK